LGALRAAYFKERKLQFKRIKGDEKILALSLHTNAGALPFSRSVRGGGALADIAAADHRIQNPHAGLLV
jgi:hypothetical protein